jgi:hypothetical protein
MSSVSDLDISNCKVFEKKKFSMIVPEVKEYLSSLNVKTAIIVGLEVTNYYFMFVQFTLLPDPYMRFANSFRFKGNGL